MPFTDAEAASLCRGRLFYRLWSRIDTSGRPVAWQCELGKKVMNGKISPFLTRLEATAKDTEDLLDRLLSATPVAGELARPARLIEAIRYSSLGGGKRFRPAPRRMAARCRPSGGSTACGS